MTAVGARCAHAELGVQCWSVRDQNRGAMMNTQQAVQGKPRVMLEQACKRRRLEACNLEDCKSLIIGRRSE